MADTATTCIAVETVYGEYTMKFTCADGGRREAATTALLALRDQITALVDGALRPALGGMAATDGATARGATAGTDDEVEESSGQSLAAREDAARQYGRRLAAELAAGRPAPPALAPPARLKNRVWVATECDPDLAGLYGMSAAAEGAARPDGLVRGFASVAEARGYISGLGVTVPDRRR